MDCHSGQEIKHCSTAEQVSSHPSRSNYYLDFYDNCLTNSLFKSLKFTVGKGRNEPVGSLDKTLSKVKFFIELYLTISLKSLLRPSLPHETSSDSWCWIWWIIFEAYKISQQRFPPRYSKLDAPLLLYPELVWWAGLTWSWFWWSGAGSWVSSRVVLKMTQH